jgi:argininosuccinate lyase
MPHKRNPDVAELVRGRCARVFGALSSLLSLLKAQPLAYNRDMQEDKVYLFDCIENVKECLKVLVGMMKTVRVAREKLSHAATLHPIFSTEMANYLTRKGLPFREAHKVVGSIIKYAEQMGRRVEELSLKELKDFSSLFDEDIYNLLLPEQIIKRKKSIGAPGRIMEQIEEAERLL